MIALRAARSEHVSAALLLTFLAIIVLLPLFFLIYGAFEKGNPIVPVGLTLDNLVALTKPGEVSALLNTLLIAVGTLFFTLPGFFFAWIIACTDTPFAYILEKFIISPIFLSPFITAIGWLTLAAPKTGLLNILLRRLTQNDSLCLFNIYNYWGIIFVMALTYIPYTYLLSVSSFRLMNPSIEESARAVGAGRARTLWSVTLPILRPAILSSIIVIFVLAADTFSVPAVIGAPRGFFNIPWWIYYHVRMYPGNPSLAAALSLQLLFITILGTSLYRRTAREAKRFVTVTGRGYRSSLIKLGKLKYVTFTLCAAYVLLSVGLPYAALFFGSLMIYPGAPLRIESFTLVHWQDIYAHPIALESLQTSFILALAVSSVCVLVATLVAYVVLRFKTPLKGAIDYMSTIPIAIPAMVFSLGLIWAFVQTPLYGTVAIVGISTFVAALPLGSRTIQPIITQVEESLEECSKICGGSTLTTIRTITMPLIKAGILSAWVLCFITVIKNLSGVLLIYPPGMELAPVVIWDFIDNGQYGRAYVLSILLSLMVAGTVLICEKVFKIKLVSRVGV